MKAVLIRALYFFLSIIVFYILMAFLVYRGMGVDRVLYLHVAEKGRFDHVTSFYIPKVLELIMWDYSGERDAIYSHKFREEKVIFLFNLLEDSELSETGYISSDAVYEIACKLKDVESVSYTNVGIEAYLTRMKSEWVIDRLRENCSK